MSEAVLEAEEVLEEGDEGFAVGRPIRVSFPNAKKDPSPHHASNAQGFTPGLRHEGKAGDGGMRTDSFATSKGVANNAAMRPKQELETIQYRSLNRKLSSRHRCLMCSYLRGPAPHGSCSVDYNPGKGFRSRLEAQRTSGVGRCVFRAAK